MLGVVVVSGLTQQVEPDVMELGGGEGGRFG